MITYHDIRNDEELVALYRNSHDTGYIRELYRRYYLYIYAAVIHLMKKQEHAKKITLQMYDFLKDDLRKHGVRNFAAWLFFAVKVKCYDYAKQHKLPEQKLLEDEFGSRYLDALYLEDKNKPLMDEEAFETMVKNGKIQWKNAEDRKLAEAFFVEHRSLADILKEYDYTEQELVEKLHILRTGKDGKKKTT